MDEENEKVKMGIFEKYLTFWIILFMVIGVLLGQFFPFISDALAGFQFAGFSIPIAICLFFMMYPTLINIELAELKNVAKAPKPLLVTVIANWAINPVLGFFLAHAFFDPGVNFFSPNQQYIVGLLLLSASPCTAMVLFWNKFGKGDIHQGLINTSLNSVLILFLYSPLATLLIGLSGIQVPFETLLFVLSCLQGFYSALSSSMSGIFSACLTNPPSIFSSSFSTSSIKLNLLNAVSSEILPHN